MRFSWVVLFLGLGGLAMVAASEWATSPPLGETGRPHRHLRWYAPLPLLGWLAALAIATVLDLQP
jgi:hypothetical protein